MAIKYSIHFKDKLELDTYLQKLQMDNADLLEACKEAQVYFKDWHMASSKVEKLVKLLQQAINKAERGC